MNRRKFLAGFGATAAGSATVVGSGAFFSAEAERGVSVSVTTEDNAFLAMEPNSAYATQAANNEIRLEFGDSGNGGSGVAPNSTYRFPQRVFDIVNQGTQDVGFTIEQIAQPDGVTFTLTALGFNLQNAEGTAFLGTTVGPGAYIETDDSVSSDDSFEIEVTMVASNPAEWVKNQSGDEFAVKDEDGNVHTEPEGPYS